MLSRSHPFRAAARLSRVRPASTGGGYKSVFVVPKLRHKSYSATQISDFTLNRRQTRHFSHSNSSASAVVTTETPTIRKKAKVLGSQTELSRAEEPFPDATDEENDIISEIRATVRSIHRQSIKSGTAPPEQLLELKTLLLRLLDASPDGLVHPDFFHAVGDAVTLLREFGAKTEAALSASEALRVAGALLRHSHSGPLRQLKELPFVADLLLYSDEFVLSPEAQSSLAALFVRYLTAVGDVARVREYVAQLLAPLDAAARQAVLATVLSDLVPGTPPATLIELLEVARNMHVPLEAQSVRHVVSALLESLLSLPDARKEAQLVEFINSQLLRHTDLPLDATTIQELVGFAVHFRLKEANALLLPRVAIPFLDAEAAKGRPADLALDCLVVESCILARDWMYGRRTVQRLKEAQQSSQRKPEMMSNAEAEPQILEIEVSEAQPASQPHSESLLPDMAEKVALVTAKWTIFASDNLQEVEKALEALPEVSELATELLRVAAEADKPDEFISGLLRLLSVYGAEEDAEVHAVLLERLMARRDFAAARQLVRDSFSGATQWGSAPETRATLLRFLQFLTEEVPGDIRQTMRLYDAVKLQIPSVDLRTAERLIVMALAHDWLGDALHVLRTELNPEILRRKPMGSEVPEMETAVLNYVYRTRDVELAWGLFCELAKHVYLSSEHYLPAMRYFCSELQRPDAALRIFGQARRLHRTEGFPPPSNEMYTYLFRAMGRQLYEDGVLELHAALKTDLSADPDTAVMNAVLSAYCDLQDPLRLRDTFEQLCSFPAGKSIDNETVSIMVRAQAQIGGVALRSFWQSLRELPVTPDAENYREYIRACGYAGEFAEALAVADGMAEAGVAPTVRVVETLYNWTLTESGKQAVRQWAAERYPELWQQAEARGLLREETYDESDLSEPVAVLRERVAEQITGGAVTAFEPSGKFEV